MLRGGGEGVAMLGVGYKGGYGEWIWSLVAEWVAPR